MKNVVKMFVVVAVLGVFTQCSEDNPSEFDEVPALELTSGGSDNGDRRTPPPGVKLSR